MHLPTPHRKLPHLLPAAAVLALTLALVACGGNDEPPTSSPPPGSGAPTANKPNVCKD